MQLGCLGMGTLTMHTHTNTHIICTTNTHTTCTRFMDTPIMHTPHIHHIHYAYHTHISHAYITHISHAYKYTCCTHLPHTSSQTQAYHSYTPHTTCTSLPLRALGSYHQGMVNFPGSNRQHNCPEHSGNPDLHGNPWKSPKESKERW